MGALSTHVLDTARGRPAAGVRIELWSLEGEERRHLKTLHTNADGRTDAPLLAGPDFAAGGYEIVFGIGAYFRGQGAELPEPPLFVDVRVDLHIADADQRYHVPLLVTPWSYSTYRGS